MDKIGPNEYVRTIRGEIGTFERYSLRKETSIYKSSFDHFIKLQGRKTHLQCDKPYIVKHSKNIIDLIEKDDYINGEKVIDIFNPEFLSLGELPYVRTQNNKYEEQDIKTILTKEQMENNCYRIGE